MFAWHEVLQVEAVLKFKDHLELNFQDLEKLAL